MGGEPPQWAGKICQVRAKAQSISRNALASGSSSSVGRFQVALSETDAEARRVIQLRFIHKPWATFEERWGGGCFIGIARPQVSQQFRYITTGGGQTPFVGQSLFISTLLRAACGTVRSLRFRP